MPRLVSRSFGRAIAVAVSLMLSVAATLPPLSAQRAPGESASRPSLVVFLTIDQMIPDYFTRFGTQFTGGLRRLQAGGVLYTNGYQDHATTETAPGHASTMSGRFPAHTGIVRNNAGVNDNAHPLVGGGGAGASPFRFQGTTVTDWLVAADPRSRALSVSRKDRGAILPIGRSKTLSGEQRIFERARIPNSTSPAGRRESIFCAVRGRRSTRSISRVARAAGRYKRRRATRRMPSK